MTDPERSKFWSSDADDDNGNGGGGDCTSLTPLSFGSGRIGSNTVTRYLEPTGSFTGSNVADQFPIPWRVQAPGDALRFQIRVRDGNGNGNDVVYELMELVAGVPTPLPNAPVITLASTFTGLAEVTVTNALVDGTELVVEIRKAASIGQSPADVQAFVQVKNKCGGGGGEPGVTCCAPQYLSQQMHLAFAFQYLTAVGGTLDLDASVCGQDEPITAVIRSSALFPPATPPAVTGIAYSPATNVLRVAWDGSGTDGNFVLEITNACGCCYVHPLAADSA